MIEDAAHVLIQFPDGPHVESDWKHHVGLARTVLSHVLRIFVEAGVDRVVLVPRDKTAGARRFGVHQPGADARDIFFREAPRPGMLMAEAMSVHFQDLADQLSSKWRGRLDLL